MNKTLRYFLATIVLVLAFPFNISAVSGAEKAEKLYASGKYEEALQFFLNMTKQGEGADLYYNIGNCYFRLDSIPQALLWYERAYLLNPSDSDIRYNLQYARTKTIDRLVPEEDIFIVNWYRALQNAMSAEGWTITGIVFFALSLAALCMFFFLSNLWGRKLGFFGAILLFFLMIFSNLFAWQQKNRQFNHDRAIVFDSSISGKSSPDKAGKELFLLHEGTSVTIIDSTVKNWLQVRLPDGKQGWIPTSSVEII